MTKLLLQVVRGRRSDALLRGAGTIFDISGSAPHSRGVALVDSPAVADRLAIASDWAAVAHDLRSAIDTYVADAPAR